MFHLECLSSKQTLLHLHELFCFYKFYLNGGDGPCDNETHATIFDLVTLEPCLPIDSRCDIKTIDAWEVSNDGESLATCLEIGGQFCYCSPRQHGKQCWFLGFNVCGRVAYGD